MTAESRVERAGTGDERIDGGRRRAGTRRAIHTGRHGVARARSHHVASRASRQTPTARRPSSGSSNPRSKNRRVSGPGGTPSEAAAALAGRRARTAVTSGTCGRTRTRSHTLSCNTAHLKEGFNAAPSRNKSQSKQSRNETQFPPNLWRQKPNSVSIRLKYAIA